MEPSPKKPRIVFERVQSLDLAQALVWPKPYTLKLNRDPFMPLLGKFKSISGDPAADEKPEIYLRGVVNVGDKGFALIESPLRTKTYKEGDLVEGYSVYKIESKSVVLKKGDKQIEIKIKGGGDRE